MKQSVVRLMKPQFATSEEPSRVADFGLNWLGKLPLTLEPQEHGTAIPGLTLYRRTDTTACFPATYEPSVNVFVQG
jgi:hypothetical protein